MNDDDDAAAVRRKEDDAATSLAIRKKVKKKRSGSRLLSTIATTTTPTTTTGAAAAAVGGSSTQNNKANKGTKAELAKNLHKWRVGPPPRRGGLTGQNSTRGTTIATVTATTTTSATTASASTATITSSAAHQCSYAPKVNATAAGSREDDCDSLQSQHENNMLASPLPLYGGGSSSGPSRTLNPKGITDPLINDIQAYSLLQAAREWSLQANMIKYRPRNESLGDSWWAEQLPNAMENPFLMHALLATGGTFVAIKTKCKDQTPGILFHNVRSMSLLRQQLVKSHSSSSTTTLSTLQTLMLLSAFAFYVGDSHAGLAHLRAAHLTVKNLGGFGNVPWATKTFLISALMAISTELKLKPIVPIEEWDEGPLDEQLWMSSDIRREIDAMTGTQVLWSAPLSSFVPLSSSSSSSMSLESDDTSFSWRNWLLPTKHLFSLLDFVKSSSPSAQSPTASLLLHWIHNRRFVIKARLLEEYLSLIDIPKVTFPGDHGVHRRLDACSCLVLIFCQSLIMFDVPQLPLMHEPRQQLGSLIAEIFQPTIWYGSQQDHESLLWVTFVGAVCELTLNPRIAEAMTTSREQAWFSTTFLQCAQALSMKIMDLQAVFNKFIWHEEKLLPYLYVLEEMKNDCLDQG